MNPDHDGSKTVAIGANVETVEKIAQANEKNYIQLLLQTMHFYDINVHFMNAHRMGGIWIEFVFTLTKQDPCAQLRFFTVENISQANALIALVSIAIMLIKRKEYKANLL